MLSVSVAETEKWSVIATFPKPKTSGLQFSPKGNFLVTWEPYQGIKIQISFFYCSLYNLLHCSYKGHTS